MSEVKEKLDEYIEKGNKLGKEYPNSSIFEQNFNNWSNDILCFLQLKFTENASNNFVNAKNSYNQSEKERKFPSRRRKYIETELASKLGVLNAIKENLSSFQKNNSSEKKETKTNSNKIFIVHGRDDVAKLSVESFLTTLGLEPIILHKQANQGKTIIEKIEAHSDVDFAVVLLTPDDEGRLKGEEKLEARARQNVIFELGYFMGKLDRKYVCGLCKEGFELPSDYHGITYITMDKHDGWHNKLAKELKAAGIEFDEKELLKV